MILLKIERKDVSKYVMRGKDKPKEANEIDDEEREHYLPLWLSKPSTEHLQSLSPAKWLQKNHPLSN
jgi:hypothetical protein